MLVYNDKLINFIEDTQNGLIVPKIVELFKQKLFNIENSQSQIAAFNNSLQFMNNVLNDNLISKDLQVAIEFQIPLTSKRVDFIISGLDENNKSNVIIIELKQWQTIKPLNEQTIVSTFVGGKERITVHPSYQAYTYSKMIEEFNEDVRIENIKLFPCAFLHNFPNSQKELIENENYRFFVEKAPVFLQSDIKKLREFISTYVKKGDQGKTLYKIDNGKIKPSKSLQDSLAKMLRGNKEFLLIDEQEVAYRKILEFFNESNMLDNKTTIIIEGGPGTGKTVIAINILSNLLSKKFNVAYVTKNAAPRNVFFSKLQGDNFKMSYVKNLFLSSGTFINSKENDYDCLLVDEAHRLNEKSGIYSNLGENQIKEIINASKISVFFIDEKQKVTAKDAGTIDSILYWAKKLNANVIYDESTKLVSQFRCNGSDGYLAFLDNLLEIKETANYDIKDLDYDFKVFDSPTELREELRSKNEKNNKSRLVAGYCYNWVSKKNKELYDIILEDGFQAKWNLSEDTTYAISKNSFDQIGCIHTVQGIEFEYVGVIIGKDLTYNGSRVVTDSKARAKTDQSLKGASKYENPEQIKDEIIRNTYKTLMTRGQKGCYIYCEDKELSKYIKRVINL